MPPARFLVVGGCLAQVFPEIASQLDPQFRGDSLLLNNFDPLPESLPFSSEPYDFQIVHIPLRAIIGNAYFRLPDDGSQHEELLRQTQGRLARYLSNALKWNIERRLLTFVLGFFVPQQNPLGRFQPRYDLRNVMHFIERLNMFLAAEIACYANAYWVDVDQLSAGIGKKFCQDDMVWSFTHGTTLSDGDHDHNLGRIEPTVSMQNNYIEHLVMSCRALGLGIEETFLAHLTQRLTASGESVLLGRLLTTDANMACRHLFSRNGFVQVSSDPTLWSRSLATPLIVSSHVKVTVTDPSDDRSRSTAPDSSDNALAEGRG